MARDWRRVALAVTAAAALAGLCALDSQARDGKDAGKDAKHSADDAKAHAKKKKQDPAEAQRAIEAAGKLLRAGKADQAVQTLTAALAGGNLPPAVMAKALYTRGLAYRRQMKPAQAISDLTSALWLKGGLSTDDRADAMKERAAAYRDAGLTENGEAVATAPASKAHDRSASGKGWVTTASDGQAAKAGQSGGSWINNLFGWPEPAPKAAAGPVTASIHKSEPAADKPTRAPRIAKAWSSGTEVHASPEPAAAARGPRPPPEHKASEPKAAPRAAGRYGVQLATVRTREEALSLAAKAKREHAAALAAREPEIDQAVLGNMGAFYRVRVGPFATVQESEAVCAKLKGSGFDCMPVTR
jgi:hypothetical protein